MPSSQCIFPTVISARPSRVIFVIHSSATDLNELFALNCARIFRSFFSAPGSTPSAIRFRATSRFSRASASPTSGRTPNATVFCFPEQRYWKAPLFGACRHHQEEQRIRIGELVSLLFRPGTLDAEYAERHGVSPSENGRIHEPRKTPKRGISGGKPTRASPDKAAEKALISGGLMGVSERRRTGKWCQKRTRYF